MELFSPETYRDSRICVALSGGADSVCLLHFLHSHANTYHITLSAIHIEHGIRGEESLRDLNFCRIICEGWNIPLEEVHRDVPALARDMSMGIEETGRTVRYDAFDAVLQEDRADFVATAHHMGDVAETILFRLARGTSLSGMRAITQRQGIIRPLLHTSKTQIKQYIFENKLPYIEDSSNTDESYMRNFIRHSVMPVFEKISNHAGEHLVRFASLAAQDDEYLQSLARQEVKLWQGDYFVPVELPDPLFCRACLIAMQRIGVQKDYTCAHFEDLAHLKALQSGKKCNLPGGAEAAREYGNIIFYRPVSPMQELAFTPDCCGTVPSENSLKFDLDAFPEGCVIRNRKEGDYFTPYGGNRKTLKKYLTDKKISARVGKKLKLVACGSEVLVIVGVEISDKVKVRETTKRVGYLI